MQYELEVNGRPRQVIVRRVDGRFVVAVDGREWTIDAKRVDAHTLSLLVEGEEIRLKPDPTGSDPPGRGAGRLKPDPTGPDPPGRVAGLSRTCSHEVTLAADPATGGLTVRVGETPMEVSLTGRRRWGRHGDEPGRGTTAGSGQGPQRVVAPMPGKIVRVLVKTGEAVRARQPVVVIEAMKMENEIRAGGDGTVAEIHVTDGQSVEAGALVAVIYR